MKGLILASGSDEDYFEAKGSLLSAIDWAKRRSATLFELKAATELAELLLRPGACQKTYMHLSAALDRMPGGIVSLDHTCTLQILSRLQSGTEAVGWSVTFEYRALSAQSGSSPRIAIQAPGLRFGACCGRNGQSRV
jgi:hypothetical protein